MIIKDKVIFTGHYGYANSGDDSFAEVATWGSMKFWNKTKIHIHTVQTNHLPQIKNDATFYHKKRIKGQYRLEKYFHLYTAKYFVAAGGSILNTTFHKSDIKLFGLKRRTIGKEVILGAIGVSLGPFKNSSSERHIKDYLSSIDFLTLRDKRSYEIAQSFNLPYCPVHAFDLAALLPEIYGNEKEFIHKTTDKIVGISLCNYERYIGGNTEVESKRNNKMSRLIEELSKIENIAFRFFIFNGNNIFGDLQITQEAINNLSNMGFKKIEIVSYSPQTERVWNLINTCDLMISTRLHAAVFACFAKVPFFLNEYHKKCTDFLDDIGQAKRYRIFDADFDNKDLIEKIYKILFENEYIAPSNQSESSKRALLNFTSCKHFFE